MGIEIGPLIASSVCLIAFFAGIFFLVIKAMARIMAVTALGAVVISFGMALVMFVNTPTIVAQKPTLVENTPNTQNNPISQDTNTRQTERLTVRANLLTLASNPLFFYDANQQGPNEEEKRVLRETVPKMRDELLARYPLVSLHERLAYEPDGPRDIPPQTKWRDGKERGYMLGRRGYAFWSLHKRKVEAFIEYPGQGISRLMPISAKAFDRPESKPIPMPRPFYAPSDVPDEPPPVPLAEAGVNPMLHTVQTALQSVHSNSLTDFLDPNRFGWVTASRSVAGFESHRFSRMPVLSKEVEEDVGRWQVQRLQLVSLLKYEEPKVYISANLPFMDELKDVPTRSLDDFESTALERLHQGEDVIVQDGTNRVYMLGAIRAGNDCLACHYTRRAALLGAFSYELVRSNAIPSPVRIP